MAQRPNIKLIAHPTSLVVILADIEYWNNHYEELKSWCDARECEVKGMTVTVPDLETLTLFKLRWA